MTSAQPMRRYHALDQLRAIMMMLGLVIHSAVSFTVAPMGDAWPYQDSASSGLFDILVFYIHVFRMPTFFLIAGFFSAYLYYQRGPGSMVRNRWLRVGVPFLLFLPVLFIATSSGFIYSAGGGLGGGTEAALSYLTTPTAWFAELSTIHMWFLYYLLIFYVAMVVLVPVVRRVVGSRAERIVPLLGRAIHSPIGILGAIAVTFVSLLPMRFVGLDTENGFLVQPKILVAYGVFVVFGWLLFLNRDRVDAFADRAWLNFGLGTVASAVYLTYVMQNPPGSEGGPRTLGILAASAAMWFLIYGFTGLFVRYLDNPSPWGRYFSDASYWLYLIHLPITIWVPGLLSETGWPAGAKFAITLSVTTAITVATYDLFVRSTAIGALLNGRRYARTLPRYDENGVYVKA